GLLATDYWLLTTVKGYRGGYACSTIKAVIAAINKAPTSRFMMRSSFSVAHDSCCNRLFIAVDLDDPASLSEKGTGLFRVPYFLCGPHSSLGPRETRFQSRLPGFSMRAASPSQ